VPQPSVPHSEFEGLERSVEEVAGHLEGEATLSRLREELTKKGCDTRAVSDRRLQTLFERTDLVLAVEPALLAGQRTLFRGSRLLIAVTEREAEGGFLIPGHRFVPLHCARVAPWECSLEVEGDRLPTRLATFEMDDLEIYHILAGPQALPSAIADAGNDPALMRKKTPRVRLRVFDLPPLLLGAQPKTGDLLLATCLDWLDGRFSVELVAAGRVAELFTEAERWMADLERGFEETFRRLGAMADTPRTLAYAYYYAGDWARCNPQLNLGGMLQRSRRVNLVSLHGQACIWRADEIPGSSGIEAPAMAGDHDSLEAILEDLGLLIEPSVIEAYLRNEWAGGERELRRAIEQSFGGPIVFASPAQEEAWDRYIAAMWDRIATTWNTEREQSVSPVRGYGLQLYDGLRSWMRDLDAMGVEVDSLPPEKIGVVAQGLQFLEGMFDLLNGDESMDLSEAQELLTTLESFAEVLKEATTIAGQSEAESTPAPRSKTRRKPARRGGGKAGVQSGRGPGGVASNAGPVSGLRYVIKVSLRRIRPPIWRRLELPAHLTLGEFHEILQMAMGWSNTHLHSFDVGGVEYSEPSPDDDWRDFRDEDTITVAQALPREKASLIYEYDFGDRWEHKVVLEKILPAEGRTGVQCLAGRRACPPEDCGGPWGYQHLLEVRESPDDPESRELLEWAGDLDPEHLDLEELNAILSRRFA
jgi:hypothetical protein